MKKLYVIAALALLSFSSAKTNTEAKESIIESAIENQYENVQYIDYADLTEDVLKEHKNDTIVCVTNGIVDNENGDGTDKDGYYINYSSFDAQPGEEFKTYFVFNSGTESIDDIVERYDENGVNKHYRTVYGKYEIETEDGNLWDVSDGGTMLITFDMMNTADIFDDEIVNCR